MFYVYFIKSSKNDKVYVGSTSKEPDIRLIEHNNNSNKWSKQNKPFKLVYYETYECKTDALKREKFYKSGFGRKIKDAIISAVNN